MSWTTAKTDNLRGFSYQNQHTKASKNHFPKARFRKLKPLRYVKYNQYTQSPSYAVWDDVQCTFTVKFTDVSVDQKIAVKSTWFKLSSGDCQADWNPVLFSI